MFRGNIKRSLNISVVGVYEKSLFPSPLSHKHCAALSCFCYKSITNGPTVRMETLLYSDLLFGKISPSEVFL